MENKLLDRIYLESYIKDFKIKGIIKENGMIDKEKYQSWFLHYVSSKEATTIKDKIEVIEEANFIAKEACLDLNVKADDIPIDGDMDENKVAELILKDVSKAQIKKELKEVLDNVLATKKEEKSLNKENKENNDNNDKNEDNNTANEANSLDDEALFKACLIILPLMRNQLAEENTSSEVKKEEALDYAKILEEYGFTSNQVAKALDEISNNIEVNNEKRKEKKEASYNAYADWRYIYYMSMLGKGFAIYYDPKVKSLAEVIKENVVVNPVGKPIEDIKKSELGNEIKPVSFGNTDNEEDKTIEDDFLLSVMKFRSNTDVDVEKLTLIADFSAVDSKEKYKETYKKYFEAYYEVAKYKMADLREFAKSFDELIKNTCDYVNCKEFAKFGGMKGEEFFVFGLSIKEKDYNVSKQLENEVSNQFGKIENVNGKALTSFLEEKFNKASNLGMEENHDLLRDAMACYLLLKNTHESRGKWYKVAHLLDYLEEKRSVNRMKNIIEDRMNASRENDQEEFREMVRRNTVYHRGFDQERAMLHTMSIEIDNNERENSRLEIRLPEESGSNVALNNNEEANTRANEEIEPLI